MVGRVKKPTKLEAERLQKLHELPCQCSGWLGIDQPNRTTAHHLLSGGRRRGHMFTVNISEWHHYARPIPGWTDAEMTAKYGPSLALGSRAFHEFFGDDQTLLDRANAMLEKL